MNLRELSFCLAYFKFNSRFYLRR